MKRAAVYTPFESCCGDKWVEIVCCVWIVCRLCFTVLGKMLSGTGHFQPLVNRGVSGAIHSPLMRNTYMRVGVSALPSLTTQRKVWMMDPCTTLMCTMPGDTL